MKQTKKVMKATIQQKLQEKGIKIHELAKHLSIDASLMSRILANKRILEFENLIAWFRLYRSTYLITVIGDI